MLAKTTNLVVASGLGWSGLEVSGDRTNDPVRLNLNCGVKLEAALLVVSVPDIGDDSLSRGYCV